MEKPVYGGQAVVEGVMFAGKKYSVTAIRRNDNSIDYLKLPRPITTLATLKKIPFLRGIIAIVEASANGSKHLQFSTDRFEVDPNTEVTPTNSKWTNIFGIAVVGVLSFIFAKLLFTGIPVLLAALLKPIFQTHLSQIIVESLIKLMLLLVYIYFISLTPLVKRVFEYHGAEHKVIHAYENLEPLTVENVQKQSRLHYRCGSSFILFTIIISFFIYMFVPTDPLWLRLLNRIALIPVVLGVSFEVLQLTNKFRTVPVLRFLGYPGLWLQLLTTKEPSNTQVEVAIASFNELLRLENKQK